MRPTKFLFFLLILGSLVFSGCIQEYGEVTITSVDVMPSQGDASKLTITPYIQNNRDTDTGALSIKVKIRDPSTNLIVAERDSDIGYIKSKSSAYNSVSLTVSNPGEYGVEVQVFEGGKSLSQYYTQVIVKPTPGPGQQADIKLTDMTVVVTKIYSDGTSALLDVSPGLYNQGGDSKPLTVEVTARVDQYTAPSRSVDIGILKGTSSIRGKVSFDLPRNRDYSFEVSVTESGRNVARARVPDKIKLNELKFNTPMTYVLVEEGKPIATAAATATKAKEPGFEGIAALAGILLVYGVYIRNRRR